MQGSKYLNLVQSKIKNCVMLWSATSLLKQKVSELGTFEWWTSGLMLDPLLFLISRFNSACSPLVINLQIK